MVPQSLWDNATSTQLIFHLLSPIVASFLVIHNDRGKELSIGFQLYYTTVQTRPGYNMVCRLLSQYPDCFRSPGPFLVLPPLEPTSLHTK